MACWRTKAAISLKRVKIEEKLLWGAYRKSRTFFRTVPSATPYGLPFHKIGGSQPHPKNAVAIIWGTAKATDCKFGQYIQRVHPNTNPWNILEKRERERIQGRPKYFSVRLIISGTCKATNFKFGRYIHKVHANKSPLKSWEKKKRGHVQGLPNFFEYPLLFQERVKLRTSNLAGVFTASMQTKSLKIWEKMERGRIQGLPEFFEYPLKRRTSNFVRTFLVSIKTEAHYKFREK